MSTLLMTGILFSVAGFLALLMKKRFEQQLPLAVGSIVAVLYVFGLFGRLQWGLYAVVGCAVAGVFAQIALLIAKRRERRLKYLFTPGTAAFGLIAFWLLVSFREYMFSEWDDFSHWGLAVKNMYLYSALPSGVPQATITYTDYPPASTLFSWLWTALSGVFNELDPQRALNMLMFCYLLPAMKDQEWKKPGKALCMLLILFSLPLLFGQTIYRRLQVDALIGCMVLYIMYTCLNSPKDRASYLGSGMTLFLLPLTKEMGLAFAILCLCVLAVDEVICSGRLTRQVVNRCVLLAMAILIGWWSWNRFLYVYTVPEVWQTNSITIEMFVDLFTGRAHPDKYTICRLFIERLCYTDLWQNGHLIKMSFVGWMIVLAIVQKWMVSEKQGNIRLRSAFGIMKFGLAFYAIALLCTYLFMFRLDEALSMNSLERYLCSYLIPLTGVSVFLTIEILDEKLPEYGLNATLCVLASLLLIVNPETIVKQTLTARFQNTTVYENRMQEWISEELRAQIDPVSDRVYVVAMNDDGYQYYLDAYQFTPVPIQQGMWTTWLVANKTDDWTEKSAVQYSPQEWQDLLTNGSFTHVYLDTIDERFCKDYQTLFESRQAIREGGLYRIEMDNNQLNLIHIQ